MPSRGSVSIPEDNVTLRLEAVGNNAHEDGTDSHPLELSQHLAELRTRLIRAALYAFGGGIVAYFLFPLLFKTVTRPIREALSEIARRVPHDQQTLLGGLVFHSFAGPFFLRLQLSLVTGLVIAAPLVVLEIWGFVLPALTRDEKRFVRWVAPGTVLLFILGAGLAYFCMPWAVHWFLSYLADFQGAVLLQDPQDYILFVVKMMLAFGIVFQLPLLMMGLGRLGILTSATLKKYWRHGVVAITTLAMIITPSNDPLSMLTMAIPLAILFLASIWLVKLVEPKPGTPGRG